MQPVSSAALPAVTCPTRKNSIGLICIHMFTLAVLCIRAAIGLPPKGVLRVRGCLQLTWLGELVRTFSSEPGTRGPGHHDAMTEAPGRKNDCHFSSVPGARGRTAKIGEVFACACACCACACCMCMCMCMCMLHVACCMCMCMCMLHVACCMLHVHVHVVAGACGRRRDACLGRAGA